MDNNGFYTPCQVVGITGKARSGKDTVAGMIKEELEGRYEPYSFANPLKETVNEMFGWDERHGWGDLKEDTVTVETTGRKIIDAIHNNLEDFFQVRDELKGLLDLDYSGLNDPASVASAWVALLSVKGTMVSGVAEDDRFANARFGFKLSPRQAYQWFGTEIGREQIADDIWIQMAYMHLTELTASRKTLFGMIIPDVRFDNESNMIHSPSSLGVLIHIRNKKVDSGVVHGHVSENGVAFEDGDVIIHNNGSLDQLREAVREVIEKKILDANNTQSLEVGV